MPPDGCPGAFCVTGHRSGRQKRLRCSADRAGLSGRWCARCRAAPAHPPPCGAPGSAAGAGLHGWGRRCGNTPASAGWPGPSPNWPGCGPTGGYRSSAGPPGSFCAVQRSSRRPLSLAHPGARAKEAGIPLLHGQPQHGRKTVGFADFEIALVVQLLMQSAAADAQHPCHMAQLEALAFNVGADLCGICHQRFSFHLDLCASFHNLWLYYSSMLIFCQLFYKNRAKIVDF